MITLQSQIRAEVTALLLAATGVPAGNVFNSPHRDIPKSSLPALVIGSHSDKPEDSSDDMSQPHPRIYTLEVAAIVAGRGDEDATDALAMLIRQAILTPGTPLSALCGERLIGWELQEWNGSEESDGPVSATSMHFSFHYLWSPEW
jgi:hypothetical protein